eukprot:UN2385
MRGTAKSRNPHRIRVRYNHMKRWTLRIFSASMKHLFHQCLGTRSTVAAASSSSLWTSPWQTSCRSVVYASPSTLKGKRQHAEREAEASTQNSTRKDSRSDMVHTARVLAARLVTIRMGTIAVTIWCSQYRTESLYMMLLTRLLQPSMSVMAAIMVSLSSGTLASQSCSLTLRLSDSQGP